MRLQPLQQEAAAAVVAAAEQRTRQRSAAGAVAAVAVGTAWLQLQKKADWTVAAADATIVVLVLQRAEPSVAAAVERQ